MDLTSTFEPLFPLGLIFITPGALKAAKKTGDNLWKYLKQHNSGQWGELCLEDKMENEIAIRKRDRRVFSAYHCRGKINNILKG